MLPLVGNTFAARPTIFNSRKSSQPARIPKPSCFRMIHREKNNANSLTTATAYPLLVYVLFETQTSQHPPSAKWGAAGSFVSPDVIVYLQLVLAVGSHVGYPQLAKRTLPWKAPCPVDLAAGVTVFPDQSR